MRRITIGAMIAIPFSPFFTKRPSLRQALNPATRVASGHCAEMSITLRKL